MNIALALIVGLLVLADQSLRDAARTRGGTATNSINYFEPVASVASLTSKADYVVHARVISSSTLLVRSDTFVATDYTVAPLQIIKQRSSLDTPSKPGLPPGAAVVRRAGGTVVEGQSRYTTINASMPEDEAPKVGDEVIWFLQYNQEDAVFTFAAGPFSAFRVIDGNVKALTRAVEDRRGDSPVDLATFLQLLRGQNSAKH